MLEWLKGLTEEQRMLIVGLIAQYIVQLEKLICAKLKWNIEEAKLTKLTMAAVTTGLAALVINGIEPAFWKEWLLAFISAVVLHEVGGKVVRKAGEVVGEAVAASAMPYVLIGTLALAFCLCAPPAAAEPSPWFSETAWSAFKTSDTLESIGAGPSLSVYQWAPDHAVWLDGALLYDGAADAVGLFGGLSTEIKGVVILEALTAPVRLLSKDLLDNAGLGVKVTHGDVLPLAYVTTRF